MRRYFGLPMLGALAFFTAACDNDPPAEMEDFAKFVVAPLADKCKWENVGKHDLWCMAGPKNAFAILVDDVEKNIGLLLIKHQEVPMQTIFNITRRMGFTDGQTLAIIQKRFNSESSAELPGVLLTMDYSLNPSGLLQIVFPKRALK